MSKRIAISVVCLCFCAVALSAAPETSSLAGKVGVIPTVGKKPTKRVVPLTLPLTPLSDDHRDVSTRVNVGSVACEKGASVDLKSHATSEGRFLLVHGSQKFVMEPTLTTTGAIRLEDPLSGVVWLQLANKSMLLNQRLGKRLADGCMTQGQAAVAIAMERGVVPGLLDAPETNMPTVEK